MKKLASAYLSKIAKISIAIFDQTLRFEARIKKHNHGKIIRNEKLAIQKKKWQRKATI